MDKDRSFTTPSWQVKYSLFVISQKFMAASLLLAFLWFNFVRRSALGLSLVAAAALFPLPIFVLSFGSGGV
jgi:hypothetical protein